MLLFKKNKKKKKKKREKIIGFIPYLISKKKTFLIMGVKVRNAR
jgi:hypothetical protein